MADVKETINYADFKKIDMRVGEVVEAADLEESDKLLKLTVDFGPLGQRTILSGIKKWYSPDYMKGKKIIFVVNLEPKEMFGLKSEGMILASDSSVEDKPALLIPEGNVANGDLVL